MLDGKEVDVGMWLSSNSTKEPSRRFGNDTYGCDWIRKGDRTDLSVFPKLGNPNNTDEITKFQSLQRPESTADQALDLWLFLVQGKHKAIVIPLHLQYSAMDPENEPQPRRVPTLVHLCQRGATVVQDPIQDLTNSVVISSGYLQCRW